MGLFTRQRRPCQHRGAAGRNSRAGYSASKFRSPRYISAQRNQMQIPSSRDPWGLERASLPTARQAEFLLRYLALVAINFKNQVGAEPASPAEEARPEQVDPRKRSKAHTGAKNQFGSKEIGYDKQRRGPTD